MFRVINLPGIVFETWPPMRIAPAASHTAAMAHACLTDTQPDPTAGPNALAKSLAPMENAMSAMKIPATMTTHRRSSGETTPCIVATLGADLATDQHCAQKCV